MCACVCASDVHVSGRECAGKGRGVKKQDSVMALVCNLKVYHSLLLSVIYEVSRKNPSVFCWLRLKETTFFSITVISG